MRKILLVPVLALAVAACTASQVQQIEQLIGIAVNAIPSIITLLGGSTPAITAANTAKSDFSLAETLIASYQSNAASATTTAQKVDALLADAQQNLNAVVAAIPASAANKQKIGAVASLLVGVSQDIIADLPSTPAKATLAHVKLPKPSNVQHEINQILSQ